MKNQNPFYRFWNPYHKFATPGFTFGAIISCIAHLPTSIQNILICIAFLHYFAELVCGIMLLRCKIKDQQSKRKINEEDAKALRTQYQKHFSNDFNALVNQAPNIPVSSTIALANLLEQVYSMNTHPNMAENIPIQENIAPFPALEDTTANSPPKRLHAIKKNEKEKSYK